MWQRSREGLGGTAEQVDHRRSAMEMAERVANLSISGDPPLSPLGHEPRRQRLESANDVQTPVHSRASVCAFEICFANFHTVLSSAVDEGFAQT